MSIIIPSRCIYKKTNDKIVDNVIRGVDVGATKIIPNNKYEEVVYDEIIPFDIYTYDIPTQSNYYDTDGFLAEYNSERYIRGAGKLDIVLKYVKTSPVYLPKVQDNAFISKIYDLSNGQRSVRLKYTIKQTVLEADCHYQPSTNTFSEPTTEYKQKSTQIISDAYNYSYIIDLTLPQGDYGFDVGQLKDFVGTFSIKSEDGDCNINFRLYANDNYFYSGAIDINLSDNYTITEYPPTLSEETKDEIDYYVIDYGVNNLAGFDITYYTFLGQNSTEFKNITSSLPAKVTRVVQTIEQVTLTVYGDSEGIDTEDITINYGGDNNLYSIETNELLQDNAKITDVALTEHIANNILNHYRNGKETSTIVCSISDYYDENDSKVISTETSNKMLFAIYDEVVPTIKNEYGKDVPLSLNSNDEAKTFLVLGTRVFYDGAVWQELSLQEFASVDILRFYEVDFRAGADEENRFKIAFQIKGRGQIIIDNVLIDEVYFEEPTLWEIDAEQNVLYRIKFDGDFEQISTATKSANAIISNLGSIIDIIRWDNKMYPYMFNYQDLSVINPTIPQYIKKIANNSFRYTTADKTYVLEIPENIQEIEALAFTESKVQSFKFNHKSGQIIKLPVSGSASGMFYSKNASEKNIYTDNEYIKNYDFVADNVTATFYHLDGTLWE